MAKSVSCEISSTCLKSGAPEEIRTPDPQIRSLVLYPAELRARISLAEGAGGRAAKERHSYRLRASFARSIRHRFSAETSVFSGPDPGIPQPVKVHGAIRNHDSEGGADGPLHQTEFAAMGADQLRGNGKAQPGAAVP